MPSKYRRKQNIRIPKRVFICCEDSEKEPKYFKEYISHFRIDESRVEVIDRKSTASNPANVLKAVDSFKEILRSKDNLYINDEFWLVVDVDIWGEQLSSTIEKCDHQKYKYAVSNPCFEIWLLMHYKNDIESSPLSYNKSIINSQLAEHNLSGRFDRDYFPYTDKAICLADLIDDNTTHWTQNTGTRIYKLMRNLNELIRS